MSETGYLSCRCGAQAWLPLQDPQHRQERRFRYAPIWGNDYVTERYSQILIYLSSYAFALAQQVTMRVRVRGGRAGGEM